MEIPQTINLRGHHLWNQHMSLLNTLRLESLGTLKKDSLADKELFEYWYEKGKTKEGAKLMYVLYVIANYPETKVKIIADEDDVCAVCTNKPNGVCEVKKRSRKDYLTNLDRDTATFYGFEIGKTYSAKEIFETLKQAKEIKMTSWRGATKVVSVEEVLDNN